MQSRKTKNRHKKRMGKVVDLYPNAKEDKQPLLLLLTEAAWNFAHTALWNNHEFEEEDKIVCKDSIKIYFLLHHKDLADAFVEFCERVMLARWYVQASSHRYIPHPALWLNGNNDKGFKGTANWYEQVELKRSIFPFHHLALKILVVSYLEYVMNPSQQNFMDGRKNLLAMKELAMLQIFNNLIIHYHYLSA